MASQPSMRTLVAAPLTAKVTETELPMASHLGLYDRRPQPHNWRWENGVRGPQPIGVVP
uniref:Uncharacterized protein n=2 Tax=Oryza TaxID=4527 RepID=A0A679BD91_9ORYZ|nr:hypothetical protein [Oryza barthii]BBF89517.1 hypothetical protein [Oryza glaberrima]